jgi:hypothetical protein
MKNGIAITICCFLECSVVLFASGAHADTIKIGFASPNPVQAGQTLTVGLEVDYTGGAAPGACPLTLTPQGGPAALVSDLVSSPPPEHLMAIPDTAPPGTYILQWTCPNGLSSAPLTETIGAQPPIQIIQYGIGQASGSDQKIQGLYFGNTQGKGFINFVNSQGSFEPLSVTSWSDTSIQYTLPLVPLGSYQMTLHRNNGGLSQPESVQITPAALQGWVDLHTHPLANLGFGGDVVFGGVDVGSLLTRTMANCNSTVRAQTVTDALSNEQPIHGGVYLVPGSGYNTCGNAIRELTIHETQTGNNAYDPPDSTYATAGYPNFPTWPVWNDITRQKMWVDWIKRAHAGGLRVMVALAVNNSLLAYLAQGDLARDDASSADLQIQETIAFVNRHPDFMAVAYNSTDVYNIVSANKLAVVIGVEIDNIGNFSLNQNPITGLQAINAVDHLYEEGVRYIFPIHLVDNVFGGTALYDPLFALANVYEENEYETPTCSQVEDNINYDFSYNFSGLAQYASQFLTSPGNLFNFPPNLQPCPTNTGNVNLRGLTSLGTVAILEMMSKHMLIDIDHMSQASASQALTLAESQKTGLYPGYPLMSGHNGLRLALAPGVQNNERSSSLTQYQRLGKLHGMAGVGSVGLDACAWMNLYNAVVSAMGGTNIIAGFGTDQHLAAGMPPRLSYTVKPAGYSTCLSKCELPLKDGPCSPDSGGDKSQGCLNAQGKCITSCAAQYPAYIEQPTCNGKSAPSNVQYNAAFPMSSLGSQSWDYNSSGVAHYGMLPDFLQDVQSLPVGETIPAGANIDGTKCAQCVQQTLPGGATVVSQMKSGAQYFLDTWRLAEAYTYTPGGACPQGQTLKLCGTPATQVCVNNGAACPVTPPSCLLPSVLTNCGVGKTNWVCLAPKQSCS